MKKITVCFLLCFFVFTACSAKHSVVLKDDNFESEMIESLAFMPFIKGQQCMDIKVKENVFLDCTVSAIDHDPQAYSPGAVNEVSYVFYDELNKRFGPVLKDYETCVSLFGEVVIEKNDTLRTLAETFASELNADYVFIGILERYLDRKGTANAVEQPASVLFRTYLMNIATGATVYESSFDETQEALLSNILKASLFFRRGARWLSAEELSREGAAKILERIK